MEMGQVVALALGFGFVMGWVVGWVQGTEPLKMKVKVLQSQLRSLEQDLKWEKAKTKASQLDLERVREKQAKGQVRKSK